MPSLCPERCSPPSPRPRAALQVPSERTQLGPLAPHLASLRRPCRPPDALASVAKPPRASPTLTMSPAFTDTLGVLTVPLALPQPPVRLVRPCILVCPCAPRAAVTISLPLSQRPRTLRAPFVPPSCRPRAPLACPSCAPRAPLVPSCRPTPPSQHPWCPHDALAALPMPSRPSRSPRAPRAPFIPPSCRARPRPHDTLAVILTPSPSSRCPRAPRAPFVPPSCHPRALLVCPSCRPSPALTTPLVSSRCPCRPPDALGTVTTPPPPPSRHPWHPHHALGTVTTPRAPRAPLRPKRGSHDALAVVPTPSPSSRCPRAPFVPPSCRPRAPLARPSCAPCTPLARPSCAPRAPLVRPSCPRAALPRPHDTLGVLTTPLPPSRRPCHPPDALATLPTPLPPSRRPRVRRDTLGHPSCRSRAPLVPP
ncbi:hypothetical protein DENSPDRAFT_885184 [Dentipellis sp. KUC8613]|nr:hypothetical protein DENSPDRAFT_885184 [Dentipellis sp. KUC8613]